MKAKVADIVQKTRTSITDITATGTEKGQQLVGNVKEVAADPQVQVTTASAVGGAAVVGTAGCATGAVTGGVVGAVVGLPAAIFTFGLSIPVCAVVGTAVGGGTGATVGGTTGAVGGGAAGYYGYKHKDSIGDTINATRTKVKEYHGYAEQKVKETTKSIGEGYTSISGKVTSALGRGGSTGGTATEVKLTK